MEMKVHKCTQCQAGLKYGADKAGKKTKCPKCGAEQQLPKDEPAPAADDDDAAAYKVVFVDDEAEKKKRDEALTKKAAKKIQAKIKVRRKNIGDLEVWQKVQNGILCLFIGACIGGVVFALHGLIVAFGLVQGPEHGVNAQQFLIRQDAEQPPAEPGARPAEDRGMFFLSLVSGSDLANVAKILVIVAQVLTLMQTAIWIIGFCLCLPIENRLGTKGQLITMMCMSGVGVLLQLFFRVLPLLGVVSYVLVPFYSPEIIMSDSNIERARTPYETWCAAPTWEVLLALFVQTALQLQPILIAVFLWTIGQMLRDEPLEKRARTISSMGFAVAFIMMAYQLYASAGTSTVLVIVERAFYTLWFFGQAAFLVFLATTCQAARELLYFYLHPET